MRRLFRRDPNWRSVLIVQRLQPPPVAMFAPRIYLPSGAADKAAAELLNEECGRLGLPETATANNWSKLLTDMRRQQIPVRIDVLVTQGRMMYESPRTSTQKVSDRYVLIVQKFHPPTMVAPLIYMRPHTLHQHAAQLLNEECRRLGLPETATADNWSNLLSRMRRHHDVDIDVVVTRGQAMYGA